MCREIFRVVSVVMRRRPTLPPRPPAGAEVPLEMPDSCILTSAHEPISLIVPSVECRTYLRPPYYTECNTEYRLKEARP